MPDTVIFYKRWCCALSVAVILASAAGWYGHKVDPLCHNVEGKYQQLVLRDEEAADGVAVYPQDVYPNPAEGND